VYRPVISLTMNRRLIFLSAVLSVLALAGAARVVAQAPGGVERAVSALGRIEPDGGVLHLAAPSMPAAVNGAVVGELAVEVGDDVAAGQSLAVLEVAGVLKAALAEAAAERAVRARAAEAAKSRADEECALAEVARREADRRRELRHQEVVSSEESDVADGVAEARAAACVAARADHRLAESESALSDARHRRVAAELARATVRAPYDGRILAVHARPGELVGPEGLLELGRVDRMFVIAEVYETDAGRVRVGQKATITSDALPAPVTGRVERIRPKVHKQDVVGTDPAARKDARIVEVEILVDDPATVADRTYLQVEVVLHPGS